MKFKLSKLLTKEYITKAIVSAGLLALLLLSFFFADSLEVLLGMVKSYRKNQVSVEDISSANCKVTYLDVGQGNCTLIELPDDRVALIDCGDAMYGEGVYKFLQDKGIRAIDFLIATHADADHIGGFNYLFPRMDIKSVYRPFQIAGDGSSAETFVPIESEDLADVYDELKGSNDKISRVTSQVYKTFITNVYAETYSEGGRNYDCKVTVFYDGLKIVGSDYTFEFFAPLMHTETVNIKNYGKTFGFATMGFGVNSSNDNSAIFTFTCGTQSYLFTGDASFDTETSSGAELVFVRSLTVEEKQKLANVTVYLAGHHGASTSSSSALLKLINPKFVVVSVGEGNDYGHPHKDALDRISNTSNLEPDFLICTSTYGSVVFAEFNGRLFYASYKIDKHNEKVISYELCATIIYVCVVIVVFSVKPKKSAEGNFIDTKEK